MALRWFRFGKKQDEPAADTAAATQEEQEQEPPPEVEAAEVAEPEGASEAAKKRRRRGSRGGRGRKKPGAEAAAGASATPAAEKKAAGAPARTRADRKPERAQERKTERKPAKSSRRRTPTRRAALPAAKRELLISVDVGEQRVAILEDDRVAEVYLERPERRSIAGNIYLGVVDNVLPGMEAAFVEIGLEKNGFLYVDEIVGPELEGTKGARRIQDLIKRGQTILVQAVKDPMKSKGARLTTEISLPGRFLVYVPNGDGYGVSRRLEDDERTRLKDIVKDLDPKGGGIIVRTAAEGASAEDIERDLVFLQRLWKTIETKAKASKAPELVYEEAELPLRIVRDLFAGDFVGAQIDDDRTHKRIVSYLKKTSPHMIERVHRYREKAPLFEAFGIEQEINSTLERRVDLPSGGYLVFDYAEAFTVIDVNTGRFVGSRGKSASGRLEDTIVKNNLEAVKEVVRQLRLRDIGGIIVIDFIDMANPKNRATVEEALRSELERDRTKTYVVEISPLGLVEMTRQNVTDGPREILTTKCVVCGGDGFVVSEATHALEASESCERSPRARESRGSGSPSIRGSSACSRARREPPGRDRGRGPPALLPRSADGRPRPSRPLRGSRAGQARGADARGAGQGGQEGRGEARRGRALRLRRRSRQARRLRDRRRRRREARRARRSRRRSGASSKGVAFAVVADAAALPTPITFEAEAEKPTRAPAARKPEAAKPAERRRSRLRRSRSRPVPASRARPAPLSRRQPKPPRRPKQEETVELAEATTTADGQPKKKRTRRGTRGGRGRKKTPATAAATSTAEDAVAEAEDGRKPRAPRIHVPAPDLAQRGRAGAGGRRVGRRRRDRVRGRHRRGYGRPAGEEAHTPRQPGRAQAPQAGGRERRQRGERHQRGVGDRRAPRAGRGRASGSGGDSRRPGVRADVGVDRGLRPATRDARARQTLRYHAAASRAARPRACVRSGKGSTFVPSR